MVVPAKSAEITGILSLPMRTMAQSVEELYSKVEDELESGGWINRAAYSTKAQKLRKTA